MKFTLVAVLAVLICGVAVCAVPSSSSTIYDDNSILFDTDGLLTDISIQKLRKSIECTVDVFGRIARVGIFKVFGKLFAQYKSDAEKLVVELKSCESMTNSDLKSKCIKTIYIGYIYTVVRLDYKLDQVNSMLGFQVMRNFKHYCAIKNESLFELDEF